jgi:hypothetical protein
LTWYSTPTEWGKTTSGDPIGLSGASEEIINLAKPGSNNKLRPTKRKNNYTFNTLSYEALWKDYFVRHGGLLQTTVPTNMIMPTEWVLSTLTQQGDIQYIINRSLSGQQTDSPQKKRDHAELIEMISSSRDEVLCDGACESFSSML